MSTSVYTSAVLVFGDIDKNKTDMALGLIQNILLLGNLNTAQVAQYYYNKKGNTGFSGARELICREGRKDHHQEIIPAESWLSEEEEEGEGSKQGNNMCEDLELRG